MDSDLDLIKNLIAEGQQFDWENFCLPHRQFPGTYGGSDTPQWLAWKTRTINAVNRICSEVSPARALAKVGAAAVTQGNAQDKFLQAKESLLKSLELTLAALEKDAYGELRGPESINKSPILSNRVFVVHGHDSALKTDVERFLREIGLEPIILHRQVDEGATVIEKFEKHADVGFAFILLTPDEIAYTVDQSKFEESERIMEKRARPNVIFEFGYFIGRLGRPRVCCLYKAGVSLPSDLSGLVYKPVGESIDEQAYSIIRELKAAGYDVRL